jgi:dihydrofolate reductase
LSEQVPNIVYIATSLDGFIARRDGRIDWLMNYPNPENSDFGFSMFLESIDAIIMGRKTFEVVLGFGEWPYTKPVFVLTKSLKEIPAHLQTKASLCQGDLKTILAQLAAKDISNIYVDGAKTIQSFINLDLIDELIISRIPIILGSGIALFNNLKTEYKFKHISTDVFSNGITKSRYLRDRSAQWETGSPD